MNENARVRILLVSQMYPGDSEPDYGVFVRTLEQALGARGHTIERAVLTSRRGGKVKYARLMGRTIAASRRFRPDVVYAHFLVPTGLIAALSARYLRRELEAKLPVARGKMEVIDSGVDLQRFRVSTPLDGAPAFLCLGSLTERKNVLRLARAFELLGEGTLTFAGDGPLRAELEGRKDIHLLGAVPYDRIPPLIAESNVVCQPSLVEPFGQALLEGMACGRSVVATKVGGPPEFVPAEAGILVDPLDEQAIAAALREAAQLPSPNPAARAAAERHDVNEQARRVEAILLAARDRRAGSPPAA